MPPFLPSLIVALLFRLVSVAARTSYGLEGLRTLLEAGVH
jgi:hypothetical protein